MAVAVSVSQGSGSSGISFKNLVAVPTSGLGKVGLVRLGTQTQLMHSYDIKLNQT